MKYFLLIVAVLSILGGFMILASAKSAIHEIEAFMLFLIGTVSFSGAGIIEAIQKSVEKKEADSN